MTGDITPKTLSPSRETKVKKVVLDHGCGKWIMRSVQDTIFHSINFTAMQNVVGNDTMAAVGNWQLQVDMQEPCSAEYKNRVALATEDGVTAMVCFATLKKGVYSLNVKLQHRIPKFNLQGFQIGSDFQLVHHNLGFHILDQQACALLGL
jgi:hypothetical protein